MSEPIPPTPLLTNQKRPQPPSKAELIELPDNALVLRGGSMRLSDLQNAAEVCEVKLGEPGISVWAAEVSGASDLLAQSPVPHPLIRLSTLGRIRAAGFTVEQTLKPPHHTVWIPAGDRDEWLVRLERAFDPPVNRADL